MGEYVCGQSRQQVFRSFAYAKITFSGAAM